MILTKKDLQLISNLLDKKLDKRLLGQKKEILKEVQKMFSNHQQDVEQILTDYRGGAEKMYRDYQNVIVERLDTILKEVLIVREEETVLSHRSSDHEDRIQSLEGLHPKGQHPFAS